MPDSPIDLDLKLTPDWVKEELSHSQYMDYEGEPDSRGQHSGRRISRSEQRSPGNRDRSPRGRETRGKGPRQGRKPGVRPERKPKSPIEPAPVSVEFLPEADVVEGLTQQIRSGVRAYPLFQLARMCLFKPERHRVRIACGEDVGALYRAGEDGPVGLRRESIEKLAFQNALERYFTEETVEREPLKGNFTNVARCRLSGTLLGPTNHHSYQQAVRRLYEQRFSRRMAFEAYQREIEIVRDAEAVDAWKEGMRSAKVLRLRENPEIVFESEAEAEQYFRKHFLENEIQIGQSFDISGEASRKLPEPSMVAAIREGWEREKRFPAQLIHHLRKAFLEAGLHLFKHRKRAQFIGTTRPELFPLESKDSLSPGIAAILDAIAAKPGCDRHHLAEVLLQKGDPDEAAAKAVLASDLHWLIHSGHVIEFHDGRLDLPISRGKTLKEASAETSKESSRSEPRESPGDATTPTQEQEFTPAPVISQSPQPEQ